MSRIRTTAALAAAAATISTTMLVAAPQADAVIAPVPQAAYCVSGTNVYCSMYWAKLTNPTYTLWGRKNVSVYRMQKALQHAGIRVTVNSFFDGQTRTAIRNYQRSRLLRVTGQMDASTLRALRVGAGNKVAAPKSVAPAPTRPVAGGVSGSCGASYYDEPQMTANGERFNPSALTAAHKSLPFGTKLKVTNKATGRSVVVRINDRGPYVGGRCLDLSKAAFSAIGNINSGVLTVSYVQV